MNITRILLLLAILTFHTQSGFAQSALIWSQTTFGGSGGVGIITNDNCYFGPNWPPESTNLLFENLLFNAQDVGRVFTVSSQADDPNFNYVVNALTNGANQLFSFFVGSGGQFVYYESQLFSGVGTGPDLIGYQIQSFSLRIDSCSIVSPGRDPNHDGFWTDVMSQVTVSIYGSPVPEPGTWSLLCLGLPCGVVLFRWRRHRPSSRLHSARRQRIAG